MLKHLKRRHALQELVLDPKKFPDPQNDHPLNQHRDSSWHAYFKVRSRHTSSCHDSFQDDGTAKVATYTECLIFPFRMQR